MKVLGQKIKQLRIAAGMSQAQLAERIGVNPKTIQRYEANEFCPDTFILSRISAYFGVSSDYLLGLIGYKEQCKEESMKILPDGDFNRLYAQYLQCRKIMLWTRMRFITPSNFTVTVSPSSPSGCGGTMRK